MVNKGLTIFLFSRLRDLFDQYINSKNTILVFRWVVVACQASTLLITWQLWQLHTLPPMLPILSLPQFDLGLVLIFTLAFTLITPFIGIALHTIVVIYAVIIDQTRLQPEIVSLVFLLWGTLPSCNARTIARTHLISLWIFAGINKLLSPAFLHGTAQWILSGLISDAPQWLQANIGYMIALVELGTGILSLMPATRKIAGLAALGLHLSILLDLSPVGHNWNQSVWPWNIALALSGLALIAPWKESLLQSITFCHWLLRLAVSFVLVSPIGFYFGIMDAYLAHNLYSSNTPSATTTGVQPDLTWQAFKVPLPPEHRVFEQYFQRTCKEGDHMVITDSRWWFRRRGLEQRRLSCEEKP